MVHIHNDFIVRSSTAILSEKYRISSELRSQATAGPVSTTVGDHVGIRGAVGSLFFAARCVSPHRFAHAWFASVSLHASLFSPAGLCAGKCVTMLSFATFGLVRAVCFGLWWKRNRDMLSGTAVVGGLLRREDRLLNASWVYL